MTQDEIVNKLYAAYGTDSGVLFGITERSIVNCIVDFTLGELDESAPATALPPGKNIADLNHVVVNACMNAMAMTKDVSIGDELTKILEQIKKFTENYKATALPMQSQTAEQLRTEFENNPPCIFAAENYYKVYSEWLEKLTLELQKGFTQDIQAMYNSLKSISYSTNETKDELISIAVRALEVYNDKYDQNAFNPM